VARLDVHWPIVQTLDLRLGGALVYTMTATAPAQVEFMKQAGMPLSTQSRKTFTEVDGPRPLAYQSLAVAMSAVLPSAGANWLIAAGGA
jgi:hypothetical protein